MKKFILFSLFVLLLLCSCDFISVGPYEVLSGTYVRHYGDVYDFVLTLNSDNTCRVIEYDGQSEPRLDANYNYSYEYDTFNFQQASGTLTIEGYKTFKFALTRYDNGKALLILVDGSEKFSLDKGTIND